MTKYWKRLTQSARGELFNPLIWPFLLATLSYGIGFAFFGGTASVGKSSLFAAMTIVHPVTPVLWGVIAILTIVAGFYFLLFDYPPLGRYSGLSGFMLWMAAALCYVLTHNWLVLFSVAVPNMMFWIWQYLSLSVFNRESREDRALGLDRDRNGMVE